MDRHELRRPDDSMSHLGHFDANDAPTSPWFAYFQRRAARKIDFRHLKIQHASLEASGALAKQFRAG
jgi:hypothetical protein